MDDYIYYTPKQSTYTNSQPQWVEYPLSYVPKVTVGGIDSYGAVGNCQCPTCTRIRAKSAPKQGKDLFT